MKKTNVVVDSHLLMETHPSPAGGHGSAGLSSGYARIITIQEEVQEKCLHGNIERLCEKCYHKDFSQQEGKKCECKIKHCPHYESDFDRFLKENPIAGSISPEEVQEPEGGWKTVSEDMMIDGQKIEKGEKYWIREGKEIPNVLNGIYKVSSSSDWKENPSTARQVLAKHFNECPTEIVTDIEKLIEAAREEIRMNYFHAFGSLVPLAGFEIDPEVMSQEVFRMAIEIGKEQGRAEEREEQKRIHNSGRKMYQIGYAAALEEVKEMLENQIFHMDVKKYLLKVEEWNKTNYDVPFDDGYDQFKTDILAALSSLKEK